jgi:dihydrofolate reductase
MRKVIFGGACSLDGYFAREDGGVDWLIWSDDVEAIMKEMWPRFDTMVMGRRTWDFTVQAYAGGSKKAKGSYTGMRTYVFSRTLPAGEVEGGAEILNNDPAGFVRHLKQQEGKDIMIMGGGDIARPLLEAGVIDEIGFSIQPVLLGSGVPLWHKMSHQIDLEMLECRSLKGGCAYVTYRVVN